MNPDQNVQLREQSDLGPFCLYCLQFRPPKYINKREQMTTVTGGKGLLPVPFHNVTKICNLLVDYQF